MAAGELWSGEDGKKGPARSSSRAGDGKKGPAADTAEVVLKKYMVFDE